MVAIPAEEAATISIDQYSDTERGCKLMFIFGGSHRDRAIDAN